MIVGLGGKRPLRTAAGQGIESVEISNNDTDQVQIQPLETMGLGSILNVFCVLYRTPKFVPVAQTNERQPENLSHELKHISSNRGPSEKDSCLSDEY